MNLTIVTELQRISINLIGRDKQFKYFEILMDQLAFHIKSYSQNKEAFPKFERMIDTHVNLIFEIVEGLDSYFIEPLKERFIYNIPKYARFSLNHPLWDMPELKNLFVHEISFIPVINEFVVFLNDLINEVADNYTEQLIMKFSKNGIFELIFKIFGANMLPNEFDSMGFMVNLISKIHLHNKDFFKLSDIKKYLKHFMWLIFDKREICSNVSRFIPQDCI